MTLRDEEKVEQLEGRVAKLEESINLLKRTIIDLEDWADSHAEEHGLTINWRTAVAMKDD